MIKGIHHTGLSVRDIDAAIAYFETASAFKVEMRANEVDALAASPWAGDAEGGAYALLAGPTGYLELFAFAANREAHLPQPDVFEAGIRHICLQAIEVDPLFDALTSAGGSWHARPSGLGTGALYSYIRDPEHNIIELEGVPWGPSEPCDPWYAHTALVSPDIERLSAFYARLTGVDVHQRGTFGPNEAFDKVAGVPGVEFHGAWIRVGNATVEMWEYLAPRTLPAPDQPRTLLGWNHVCFETDNIDEEHKRLQALDIALVSGPTPAPFGHALFGQDPDGNLFEILEFDEAHSDLSIDHLGGREHIKRLDAAIAAHYGR